MQVDPVIVPVGVDLTAARAAMSELDALTMRSARESGGAAAAAAAPSARATMGDVGTAQLSVGSLARELGALQLVVHTVTEALDRLGRSADAGHGGRAPAPGGSATASQARTMVAPRPPGGGGGGGRRGRGGGGAGAPAMVRLMRNLVTGGIGAVGVGVGLGSAAGEVRSWIDTTNKLAVQTFLATIGGGGSPTAANALTDALAGDRSSLVGPMARARILAPLRRMGFAGRASELNDAATIFGEIGLRTAGDPAAGGSAAADSYRAFRSEGGVIGLWGTVAREAITQGRNSGEMLTQLQQLTRITESSQGQYRRSDGELARIANLSAILNALPGGIGQGAGGVQIVQGLGATFGEGSGPIEQAMAVQLFQRRYGRTPGNAGDVLRLRMLQEDPTAQLEMFAAEVRQMGPDAAAFQLNAKGRVPATVANMLAQAQATEGTLTQERVRELVGPDMARQFFGQQAEKARESGGGNEIAVEALKESSQAQHKAAQAMHQFIEEMKAQHPYLGLGAQVGGYALQGFSTAAMLRMLLGGGGTAASMGAEGGAASGAAGGALGGLLRTLGIPSALAADLLFPSTAGVVDEGALVDQARGMNPVSRSPSGGRLSPMDPRFFSSARKYGLPPWLLQSVADVESGFRPDAVNPSSNATGLMQFLPSTARMFGIDPRDPTQSIDGAARYMRQLINRHGGDVEEGLSDYGGEHTGRYASKVLGRGARYREMDEGRGFLDAGNAAHEKDVTLHLYLHADPNFPGTATAHVDEGGVRVRQVQ